MLDDQTKEELRARYEDVTSMMSRPEIATDPSRMAELAREHNTLQRVIKALGAYERREAEAADLRQMLEEEADPDLVEMAREELVALEEELPSLRRELQLQLIPKDPEDSRNAIVEVRAGTGGDEAALFAGDLYRMYTRYAESHGWSVEPLSSSPGSQGGFKEAIFMIKGEDAFGRMKFESGVHRVQRVPATESSGRIHTSAASVAVLPEAEEVDIDIRDEDLEIDVYRSSGPGGQSVNTTDSAVRITHKPTGLVVTCQDEKSQHKNKEKALRVLRSRLFERERERRDAERSEARRSMVGSGDRSAKIRTYNWPQSRVTDHRLEGDQKNHPLERIVDGELDEVIDALLLDENTRRLANLSS